MVRGGRVATAVIAVLALASACAARQVAGSQPAARKPSNPDAYEQLRRELRAIFSAPTVDHGVWSVAVKSLEGGETLYSSNSFRLQVPASSNRARCPCPVQMVRECRISASPKLAWTRFPIAGSRT